MESFAHAIQQLQSGALQHPEFFAQLDRVLANAPESAGRLLEQLSDAHARKPLPREVYTEVQHRIERLIAARRQQGDDDTFVQTKPGAHTVRDPAVATGVHAAGGEDASGGEPERMKGVGETLNGRFVLEECIGFGGMGTVYKALDLRKLEASDRKPYIAIKVLNVQFRGHPKSLIALQREARKAQALAHPNIVSVYDFDRDGPMVYLTMEYLKGKPLSQLLRAPGFTGLPYPDALRIVTGMANALAYAHGHGFVHCDFKPGNVFLTDAGNVKVIDFGIARVFQKAEEDVDVTVFDAGSLGALTPAYASPEMLENRDPDPRDDIFALACITYELLTGHHPFNRVSSVQARAGAMRAQRPPGLGRAQWHALKCGLALEREGRTPTVARFLDDFGTRSWTARYGVAAASGAGVLAACVAGFAIWRVMQPAPGRAPPPVAAAPAPAAESIAAPNAAAVDAALAALPCAALVATVRAHAVEVRGFLARDGDQDGLKDRLAALPGVSTVSMQVQAVDPGQCQVLSAFAPYWSGYRRAGGGAALRLAGSAGAGEAGHALREGDALAFEVRTPDDASFITVDVYDAADGVAHLLPNAMALDNRAPPASTRRVGAGWSVGKPYGGELAVLVATPAPLFGILRRESEPRAAYLAEATANLERIRAGAGTGTVAVDFLPFSTRPR